MASETAVTAKSISPEPWAGKPAPRLHMTASGMLNAVGLQGPGIAAWLAHDLPALRATGDLKFLDEVDRLFGSKALALNVLFQALVALRGERSGEGSFE